jgi:hypothetical protein
MEPRPATILFTALGLTLLIATGQTAAADPGAPPSEALLRLVPPDAAVVLTVEGLRDHARAFGGSRLADDLWRLPAVRAWLDSEKYRHFEQSRAKIETILGANLTELRDELFGDAVVLALRLPSDPTQEARGLVLVQARNQALLQRVIRIINTTQQESGELSKVVAHQRAGTTYYVREFPAAAGRPPEWYVAYPDGTLALSNSETLIQAVIDRNGQSSTAHTATKVDPGLGDLPKFKSVQHRLPERALVRLFVDPRQVERLLSAAPRPSKPSDVRVKAMIERYVAAVDYAGAAFVWSNRTLALHAVEMLDPSKLDPWILRLSHDARPCNPALRRVPPTALAVASLHVDAVALRDALGLIVPEEDQPKLINMETVLTGLFLGQDVRSRVLPRLGPGVFGYLDSPSESVQEPQIPGAPARRTWPFPPVLVVSLGDSRNAQVPGSVTVAAAVDNALRTALALTALDEKRAQARSRIVTRNVAGVAVTTLDTPIPFAYAVDRAGDRLVVSTSAESVVRRLEESSDPKAGNRFDQFQATAFPQAETFLCVDLDALNGLADRHRDILVRKIAARQNRPVADVKGDLDQVMTLARLFQGAFVSSRIDSEATAVQHSAGLILHEPGAK